MILASSSISDPNQTGAGMSNGRVTPSEPLTGWRQKLHEIIFEADTPAGKAFDVLLIIAILTSVLVVMLESVGSIDARFGPFLRGAEWFFTILFTIEYILRLICVGRPWKYATSFFGIVDLLAILPTYLDVFLPGSHHLFVIRILRLLRIFRVLRLVKFVTEANILLHALRSSGRKVIIFLFAVLLIVVIMGSVMYVAEGEDHGFTSIPRSIYWAIVTITTVGYGDITPETGLGQAIAAALMIMGYSIIAVPTGIVSAEMAQAFMRHRVSTQACPDCSTEGHETDAEFCKKCGSHL